MTQQDTPPLLPILRLPPQLPELWAARTEFRTLRNYLLARAPSAVCAAEGLGGIGKTMLAAGLDDPVLSAQQTFQDSATGRLFWLYIERRAARVIIGGYPCGGAGDPCVGSGNRSYFHPNNNVTSGQLSKIISNSAGYTETPTGQTFEDISPNHVFYLFVERMATRGIISGYPCGGPTEPCQPPTNRPYFRPGNNATRGQMSKIAASAFFPNCYSPGPTPTATNTATSTWTPTRTPTPTATNTATPGPPTPNPNCAPGSGITVRAYVSNPNPSHNSVVTVYGVICSNGVALANIPMDTTWYYRTTTFYCSGTSAVNGVASCSRNIGNASSGYTVLIDVVFRVNGVPSITTTSFTPQ